MASKQEIRKAIRSTLKTLSQQEILAQSQRAATVLEELPQWQRANRVALYLHMEKELHTTEILKAAFRTNKQVFLPRIAKLPSDSERMFETQSTHLEMLEVESLQEALDLKPQGKYQIREPTSGTDCFQVHGLDLIIIPAMAFTADCNRIGHGAGYYDSFIQEHQAKTNRTPTLVGVGLEQQLLASLPLEPHDRQLDAVIIDSEMYVHES